MTDREIKGRIKNIGDTVKITRAMQMIATTKIHGYQVKRDNAKSYLDDVSSAAAVTMKYADKEDEYFKEKTGRSAYVVITGDKGLCGDYNAQVLSYSDKLITQSEGKPKIFVVGYVGREYYKGKNCALVGTYVHCQLEPTPSDFIRMAEDLSEAFLKGNFKDLYVVYTVVEGAGETHVVSERLLPFEYAPSSEDALYVGEKNTKVILTELLTAKLFYAVASAALAVNYKRMIAMRQATINGEEMIDDLKIQYNRSRQDKITNELNDTMAGAFDKKK